MVVGPGQESLRLSKPCKIPDTFTKLVFTKDNLFRVSVYTPDGDHYKPDEDHYTPDGDHYTPDEDHLQEPV